MQGVDRAGKPYGTSFATWQRAGLAVAFLLLVVVAVQSGRMGLAGLVIELAHREVDLLPQVPAPRRMKEASRIADWYSDSLAYSPGNPWALEGLGVLDLMRMRWSTEPKGAIDFARSARRHFREALRQRPTSPFLWSNVAMSKLYLDEIDAEFFAALRRADELGPWEPTTQQAILFAGLAAWPRLDAGLRQSLVRVLERGAKRNALKMFEIVKSYRRLDLVCTVTGYDAVAGPECRKAAGAASTGPTRKGDR